MSTLPSFEFLSLGAIVKSFHIGNINIVQGFPTQELYETHNSPHFGETIGRVANRVANAKIRLLNNKSYHLSKNDGANSLHGGFRGWGRKIWDGPSEVETREINGPSSLEDSQCVVFKLKSSDGDEGYPGSTEAKVFYSTGKQFEDGREMTVLVMEYEVLLENDASGVEETVVNMTNHSYFNLGGGPSIDGTVVTLYSNMHLPVDQSGIPIATKAAPFPGITINKPFTLGASEPNIDHCFIVESTPGAPISLDSRSSPLNLVVTAHHPQTKIHLEIFTTEPAFQFYTGQYIDVPAVEGAPARSSRAGFCVEPSRYIDAVNREEWREQVVLRKGQKYGSRTVYRAWNED